MGVVLISGKQAQKLSLWGSDLNHILALNGAKVCPRLAQTPRSSSASFVSSPDPHQQNLSVNVHMGGCFLTQNHGGFGIFKWFKTVEIT